jgi:hypothetical protein
MQNVNVVQKGAVTTLTTQGQFKTLVTSDVHFDGVHCDRRQFFQDLDVAVSQNAWIIIVGDFFDAMNGRFDPRRDLSHLRPEYRREDYYDAIVNDAAEQLAPYSQNILMVTNGNHELSVLKNANTNLVGRLTNKLSSADHTVYSGGYGGIMLLNQDGYVTPIKYYHGSGGEAPVTRGAIQTNRQAVFLPDFTIILNGHSHHMYWIPVTRERVDNGGKHYFDIQHHVRTPGYQMSYGDGSGGWEVTRGGVPKPTGAFLLDISQANILPTPLIHAPLAVSPVQDMFNGTIFPQE